MRSDYSLTEKAEKNFERSYHCSQCQSISPVVFRLNKESAIQAENLPQSQATAPAFYPFHAKEAASSIFSALRRTISAPE